MARTVGAERRRTSVPVLRVTQQRMLAGTRVGNAIAQRMPALFGRRIYRPGQAAPGALAGEADLPFEPADPIGARCGVWQVQRCYQLGPGEPAGVPAELGFDGVAEVDVAHQAMISVTTFPKTSVR